MKKYTSLLFPILLFLLFAFFCCKSEAHQKSIAPALPTEKTEVEHTSLPAPTGKYAIGTETFELTDQQRKDNLAPSKPRILVGQIWYPSSGEKGKTSAYMEERLVDYLAESQFYELEKRVFQDFRQLQTHAVLSAPIQKDGGKFPLVFVLHGLGSPRAFHTILCEDLASHGYAVIALDHPYGGVTVSHSGEVFSSSMLEEFDLFASIADWSLDVKLAYEYFKNSPAKLPQQLREYLDFDRVAAGGHSLGGNIALGLDQYIPSVRGAFNMDGGSWEKLEPTGIAVEALVLRSYPVYSDAELAAKGRNKSDWEKMGKMIDNIHLYIYQKSKAPITQIKVKGTGHFSYSDAPFTAPYLINQFGGKILDKNRIKSISHAHIISFLNQLFDRPNSGLDLVSSDPVILEKFE